MPFQQQRKPTELNTKNNQAMSKYRRLKTIIKKMVAASNICGQPMSLLVYDQKLNKITEYSSDDTIRLESVYESMS